jgi:hypothetical protein
MRQEAFCGRYYLINRGKIASFGVSEGVEVELELAGKHQSFQ